MDPRGHVSDINDAERQAAPPEQQQQGFTEAEGDFDAQGYFDADFMFEAYDDHTGAVGAVQDEADLEDADFNFPKSEDYRSGVDANAGIPSGFACGHYHQHSTAVNDPEDAVSWGIFGDPGMPDEQQTIANAAAYDSVDPRLQHTLPQIGSANPTDHPAFTFLDSFNTQNWPAYPTPQMGLTTRNLMNPTISRDMASTSTALPPDPLKRTRRRRRESTASAGGPDASRVKKSCAGCEKAFYTSKDPERLRCTRCYDKHVKHTAGHTTYTFNPDMSIDQAWNRLYPPVEALSPKGDDVETARANEQDYVRRLVEAVSTPYTSDQSGSKEDQQRVAQQSKLNKKPFDSIQYRDDLVNARIRFLFHIALSAHAGGPSHYDIGGDNSGYGEDRSMTFSARIERIIKLLTLDKDIAMDVIEGRGVKALVYNPNKYERRKRDNKKSNDTKQDLQEKGKQYDMLEASASGSPPPPPDHGLGQYRGLQARLSGDTGGIAGLLLTLSENNGDDGGGGNAGYMSGYAPARLD